ncbi:MAG: hypothetical protein RBR09_13480 [Desulfobulbaceae bacterium]|jgi:hypothetical protein|nr:hypothetical protein [Deltaproteobacteria bacterium]MCK9502138.1 hypothetical protein [Lascolabacillus sp.]MDY0352260.1 hypothetical protein [Desulfobulbaceae bacterium]
MGEEFMEELDGSEPQNQAADTDKPYPGILDDDPALDIILLNEMEKEHRRPSRQNSGCAGVLLLFLVPAALLIYLVRHFLI